MLAASSVPNTVLGALLRGDSLGYYSGYVLFLIWREF